MKPFSMLSSLNIQELRPTECKTACQKSCRDFDTALRKAISTYNSDDLTQTILSTSTTQQLILSYRNYEHNTPLYCLRTPHTLSPFKGSQPSRHSPSPTKHSALHSIEEAVPTLKDTLQTFQNFLQPLSPDQCTAVCEGFTDCLSLWIRTVDDILSLLHALLKQQRVSVFTALLPYILCLVKTKEHFKILAPKLSSDEYIAVYKACKDKGLSPIDTWKALQDILTEAASEVCKTICQQLKDDMSHWEKTTHTFQALLITLSVEQRQAVYDQLTPHIAAWVDNMTAQGMTEELCIQIHSIETFQKLLQWLTPKQESALYTVYKDHILALTKPEDNTVSNLTEDLASIQPTINSTSLNPDPSPHKAVETPPKPLSKKFIPITESHKPSPPLKQKTAKTPQTPPQKKHHLFLSLVMGSSLGLAGSFLLALTGLVMLSLWTAFVFTALGALLSGMLSWAKHMFFHSVTKVSSQEIQLLSAQQTKARLSRTYLLDPQPQEDSPLEVTPLINRKLHF
jgi:hypothetical protein